jgi:DNA-binding IclR family transcriptional regulator
MAMNEGMQKILDIVAELSNGSTSRKIFDTAVVERSGLPTDEVYSYFDQLQSLKYIEMDIKVSDSDVRLLNITKEGLENSSWTTNHQLR